MASLYSTEYTKYNLKKGTPLTSRDLHGRLRVAYASYTGSAAINDNIYMFRLPKGARILFGNMAYTALGASTTASVGYSGALTRYANAVSTASAGSSLVANTTTLNTGDVLTADTDILVTIGGAAASGTVTLELLYALD